MNPNRKPLLRLSYGVLFTALITSGIPAFALESDRHQPIEIEADQGSLDQHNQSTVFSGQVRVRQGTMFINADRVEANRDKAGNQTILANGSPVTFGQQLDKNNKVYGQANAVSYASQSGVVTLTGNAKITRGSDSAQGQSIIYNTRAETYTVRGGKNGRVHIVIQPQKQK
ncbi:lipopolysaccharide transport periplasmic protein LptA [Stenoxybacter acetivorans]|uniref:lipopolysaccharide transport periplasmic protein LptA n=1 Tax=Stenoxybacter acetivorans TaxID=422441 RepID=UPI000A06737A|nr:lipopolysaccharide transport periplasmic protein LptA [Stenoxybacter acetivorans]